MISVFLGVGRAKNTGVAIRDIPVSTLQHVMSIEPVHNQHPCKEFNSHSAATLPDPEQERIRHYGLMEEGVVFLCGIALIVLLPQPDIIAIITTSKVHKQALQSLQL